MKKMSIAVGGIKTSADQEHLKQQLRRSLGVSYDNLELSFNGTVINRRPTIVAKVPSSHVELLQNAFKESLGAFSTINISPEQAHATA